jgi:hypothetical protein
MTGNSILDAIRGPVMLIAWGTLFAADQMDRISIVRTWPVIVILYGLFKLTERIVERGPADPGPQQTPGETNT